jgi:hypothetical protein
MSESVASGGSDIGGLLGVPSFDGLSLGDSISPPETPSPGSEASDATPAPATDGGAAGTGVESVAAAVEGTEQPGVKPGSPADPARPASEPFTLAGKTWTSREEGEREIATALGRYQGAQRQVSELQTRVSGLEHQAREAINVARAWHDEAQVAGGATAGKAAASPAPGQPAAPTAEASKPWFDDYDWGLLEEVAEEKGLQPVLRELASEIHTKLTAEYERKLDERLAPIQQDREAQQHTQATMQLFAHVANEQDATGAFVFPELRGDGQEPFDIVRIWRELPREIQFTRDGIQFAVWKYRTANGGSPAPAQPLATPAGATGASHGVLGNVQKAIAASSEVVSGQGSPRPAEGPREVGILDYIGGGAPPVLKTKSGLDLGFVPTSG